MDTEIQNAISELNNDLDNFIKNNEKQIEEIRINMMKNENKNKSMPLSEKLSGDIYTKSCFEDYLRKGDEVMYVKSLNDQKDEEGGHLIPSEIVSQINERLQFLSPMRAISKTITISSNSVDILTDSRMPDAGWAASSEETRDETSAPEIKKIRIPVHEIYAKPKANQRLLDDSQINVEEWLINKISEKIAELEDEAFVSGSGNDRPTGFLKYESENKEDGKRDFGKLQSFSTGANGKFSDDASAVNILIDMVCSIKPRYAKNAKWVMSRSALSVIRKLKNSDGVAAVNERIDSFNFIGISGDYR